MQTSNDTDTLEADVAHAVEQGLNIQDTVRQLTLRKISAHTLDLESLRKIAQAVLRGARSGVQKELHRSGAQLDTARTQLALTVAGLDDAFAQIAFASRLAVEEAASRAQKFSGEDLARARAELENMENMLMETLQNSASSAKDAAGEILRELAAHSRTQGSAAGAQIREALSVITHQAGSTGRTQIVAGLHLAQATSDLFRQIAAGVLTGVAEYVKPDSHHKEN